MKTKSILLLFVLCLALSPLLNAQSRDTGAIIGTVMDEEAVALPGVTMTLSSNKLMGDRTYITDENGEYRFPAIPPGSYSLKAELAGFGTTIRENIRVTTTIRLTVDISLTAASLQEEVTVVAVSPTVDIKSTETASVTLGTDLLQNMPYNNFAMDIVNLAPGVNNDVAYGAMSGTGVAYQIDGVDVSDPGGSTAWVFNDPNIVEEAKVMGVGLPAEYGNFTGVIFNLVTKSGGNEFSGMVQAIYQGEKWRDDNNAFYLDDFPELSSPGNAIDDFAINLGGPFKRDKVWFFGGGQWYRSKRFVTGFPEAVDYKQPRGFLKITAQVSSKTNFNAFFEYDAYNGVNRGAGATTAADATVNQKSPDIVGNFALTHIFSERTFFNIKAAFFHGYYYLDPETGPDIPAHYSINDNFLYDSAGYYWYSDRDRMQANAAVTHYAEDFIQGDHDFKFGLEFERALTRDRTGYTGPNAFYYVDYVGYGYTGNYLAYQYEGYDVHTNYSRVEGFVQDSWKVTDRLNISLGARLTQLWGDVKGIGNVYSNFRLAPRLGFTYDILGDKTTVFKAHWGQFTEAMMGYMIDRLNPPSAYSDYVSYYWDIYDDQWVEFERIQHEDLYTLDPNMKHPYMNQFTISVERELFQNASLTVAYINRAWKNIMGPVSYDAEYSPVDVFVSDLNQTFTIYEQDNPGENTYILQNLKKGDGWITLDPFRKFWGVQVTFNKRFADKWQLLASYNYGHAYGTTDNGGYDDVGWGGSVDSPNFWINADGTSTNDPTHMIKIQGTYVLPLQIHFNVYFHGITGNAWTQRYRSSRLNQGRVTFFTEPRGSNHYPMVKQLDLRLEKTFTFAGKYRLGLVADIFNVLNDDTITSWGTRIGYDWTPGDYPSTDGHELYGIASPRAYRIGLRLIF